MENCNQSMMYQCAIILFIMAVAKVACKYEVVYKEETSVFTKCPDVATLGWFRFQSGYFKPDPVRWPGNVTIAVTLNVGRDDYPKGALLTLKLLVKRVSPIGKVTIPWIDSLGFGTRDFDICGYLLPKYYDELCRKAGLCECPFKEGLYPIEFVMQQRYDQLVGLLVAGDYEIEAQIVWERQENNVFGCLKIAFSVFDTESSNREKSLQCWFYEA